MRERHPIDDRFKSLYDAEATPPERVRAAIGHKLGWDKAIGSGSASLVSSLLLLVGGAGAAFALYQWNTDLTLRSELARTATEQVVAPPSAEGLNGVPLSTPPQDRNMNPGTEDRDVSYAQNSSIPTTSSGAIHSTHEPTNGVERPRSSEPQPEAISTEQGKKDLDVSRGRTRVTEQAAAGSNEPMGLAITASTYASAKGATRLDDRTISETGGRSGSVLAVDLSSLEVRPTMLDVLFSFQEQEVAMTAPLRATISTDYVLPTSNWWLGAYVGAGKVNGKWTGSDAAELDAAETWKGSWQMGLLAGKQWRSGLSLGFGVGMARVRSVFEHDQRTVVGEAADLDTTWVTRPYPNSTDLISTWSIDTTFFPIAGPVQRIDANNAYSILQVPVMVAWHGDIRRWKLGATAGLTGWFPLQRSGSTLLRTAADADPTVTELSDASLGNRFPMQVHGTAGLSFGYMITEQVTILAEPVLSAPLYRGMEGTTLSLTRPTLQIRLQYELRSRLQ